jgi:hypothetical protein
MASIARKLFSGVDDVAAELARLREQVERVKADVAAEEARPVPLAELETRIGRTVAHLRAQADRVLVGDLVAAEGGPLRDQALAALPPHVVAAIVAHGPLSAWLRERALAAAGRMGEPVDAATRLIRIWLGPVRA